MHTYQTSLELVCSDGALKSLSDLEDIDFKTDTGKTFLKLVHVNLAFNHLGSIKEIEKFSNIKILNLSHNCLKALDGIQVLKNLTCFKGSYNLISDLTPLRSCINIEHLWMTNNCITLPQLGHLSSLKGLRTLALSANPSCRHHAYQLFLIGTLPSLERHDLFQITAPLRERAISFMESAESKKLKRDTAVRRLVDKHEDAKNEKELVLNQISGTEARKAALKIPTKNNNSPDTRKPTRQLDALKIQNGSVKDLSSLSILDCVLSLPAQVSKAAPRKAKRNPERPTLKLMIPQKTFEPMRQTYPSGALGLEIRKDGSGIAKWPNGKVSVSVDFDSKEGGYRLYAANKKGTALISLNINGDGFINHSDGKTWISNSSRNGFITDNNGHIITQWDASSISSAGTFCGKDPQLQSPSKEMKLHFGDNLSARVRLTVNRRLEACVSFAPCGSAINHTFTQAWHD